MKKYLGFLLDAVMPCINKIDIGYHYYTQNKAFPGDLYFLVCYKFRDSISCMNLRYNKSTIIFKSQTINIFNSLAQFKQLTKLVFHNKYDTDLTPSHVQGKCPNLKDLQFISAYPISESAMLHFSSSNNRINLNFMANLTNLDLCLLSLSATYTKYLIDYLPTQLTVLHIDILYQSIFKWVGVTGMEHALSFLKKIGRVKRTYIAFGVNDRYELQTSEETIITIYFKLLNAFKRTRQTCVEAFFLM